MWNKLIFESELMDAVRFYRIFVIGQIKKEDFWEGKVIKEIEV